MCWWRSDTSGQKKYVLLNYNTENQTPQKGREGGEGREGREGRVEC